MKNKSADVKLFDSGQAVVLLGTTKFDREVFIFNDAKSFVDQLRKTENKNHETNGDFMRYIHDSLKEEKIDIPTHSEEAFVRSLIKIGICVPAVLN